MRTLFLFLISFIPLFCFSQMENTQWRFGSQCGLSFTTNPAVLVSSNISNGGGSCSSIADAAGNLLFYTDGYDVWNRFNLQMAGANIPLMGAGSTQGVLIAKQPGNNPYYYIFASGVQGMRYSIVDMSLAAGIGSVTVKNVTLTTQIQSYKIAGTKHCNKSDVWIVSQDQGQNSWRAYQLTSTGITGPVVSNTGHTHIVYAAMKFSPDGSKIASTEWGDGVYLYDFNKSTGAVSGMTVVSGQGFAAWAVEFSPDSKKLYATRSYATVLQWDLAAGSAAAIAASVDTIYVTPMNFNGNQGALQLAPDGKIYQTYGNAQVLSIIQNPNGLGAACNYSFAAINISPKITGHGLPNLVKPMLPLPSFANTISQATCQTLQFSPITTTVGGLSSLLPTTANWIFGDPASGPSNYSSQLNPTHVYSGSGVYSVQMIIANPCGVPDTVNQVVNVPNNVSTLSLGGNTLICMGATTTLNVSGAGTYTWNSNLGQTTGATIIVNPTASLVFTVSAMNGNSCVTNSILAVTVLPPSVFYVSGQTQLCLGESATLTANGVSNYTWTTASGPVGTSSVITLNPALGVYNYTLFGFNPSLSCIGQLFITLTVSPYPTLSILGPTMVCTGDAVNLLATGASNYTWTFTGGTTSGPSISTLLSSPLNYTLSASDPTGNCISKVVSSVATNACLGLSSNAIDKFKIYPNPFQDQLEIDSHITFSLSIHNLNGQFMYSTEGCVGINVIDLSALPGGAYSLMIQSEQGNSYRKLVKLVSP